MNDIEVAELAQANGNTKEIGTSGLEVTWGQISKADNTKLFWPDVYELFNKYLRRDPQVAQWRVVSAAMASKVEWYWELTQEEPTPQEEKFLEFLHTIWDDLPGGQRKLIDTYIHYILMGWMWFENVPARRNGMKQGDWVSVHDDGLIGFRDIAFRDHSSFSKWDIDESTGRLMGFVQQDWPNPEVTIPLDRSTHITLGDPTSPEGLSPFEALWRLESFMYNLELVLGIGSEHSAGHAKFSSENAKLTAADHANIKVAARALLAAQEGNYVAVPAGLDIDIIDVPFSAAPNILEAIRFYGHLKSQVLNMQWMSLSLTSGAGSNASMFTSANMWLTAFNAQMSGAARVIGEQLATQLRRYNSGAFGDVKKMPVLKATPVEANIDLLELAQFVSAMVPVMELTEEDMAAIRRKSNFLPEIEIAEIQDDAEPSEPDNDEPDEVTEVEPMADETEEPADDAEFARPVAIGRNQPTVTEAEDLLDLDDEDDIKRMIRRIERIDPFIGELLKAEAVDDEE
jgi:hypothetical protein